MTAHDTSRWEIDFRNDQNCLVVDTDRLRDALITALEIEHVASAVLSVSIVDNAAIHKLNRDHLQHDFPTDVISFQLDFTVDPESDLPADADPAAEDCLPSAFGANIEGEIIASAEMATEMAAQGKWSADAELLLYLVHGLLHICGYDDQSPAEQAIMRSRERLVLGTLGLTPVYADDTITSCEFPETPNTETRATDSRRASS